MTHVAEAARSLAMSSEEFVAQGDALEVRVPWHPATLWVVPTLAQAPPDVGRGRIWEASELWTLLACSPTREEIQAVALTKLMMAGDVYQIAPHAGPYRPPEPVELPAPISPETDGEQATLGLDEPTRTPAHDLAKPAPHQSWRQQHWAR